MTLEIIVFVAAILFGILWYWRESKDNKIYRLVNKISNSKKLQMKPENKKGFIHLQPFLIRLVWVTVVFVLFGAIVSFVTPFNAIYIQYFASAIVGTLIGTYIASAVLFAQDKTKKENLDKVFQKGKNIIEDFTARDRFKDKGMIK